MCISAHRHIIALSVIKLTIHDWLSGPLHEIEFYILMNNEWTCQDSSSPKKKPSQASLLVTLVIQSRGKLYVSFVSFH